MTSVQDDIHLQVAPKLLVLQTIPTLHAVGHVPLPQNLQDTSEWTLDYPPLFAWFEWVLSQVAARVDAAMVQVDNLSYSAWSCVVFQRGSVMVCDLVLLYAVQQ